MSSAKATHVFVASVPCGCVAAMCLDFPKDADVIQEYRNDGYTVTRMPVGDEKWIQCERHRGVGHNEWVGAIDDQLETVRDARAGKAAKPAMKPAEPAPARLCGTCKFWGADADSPEIREADPDLWRRVRPCGAVLHDREASGPYPYALVEGRRAGVLDGSGYYASLRTREDFGCVLWEGNES